MAPRSARISGTLTSWDDERGFGFISPADGTRRAFVHISHFPPRATRPVLGETLTFELERSPEGKPRAASVRIPGQRQKAAGPARPRGHRRHGVANHLVIVAFLVGYATVSIRWPVPYWVAAIYLVASIVCFSAYAADKRAAQAGRWRVSENTLLLLGVIGGWPGAIVAQQTLRHKTKKVSFRFEFWVTVLVNVVVFVVLTTPAFTYINGVMASLIPTR